MTRPIHVLNGPNLNRLGMREPEIYGSHHARRDRGDVPRGRRARIRSSSARRTSRASSIGWIHEAIDADAGIVINPAGLSFRSIPLIDALRMVARAR